MSRPNWERHHLGGATGTTGTSPFIGVAGVSPATGPTGILPVVEGANQTTPNPRAITVRNNHTPRADHALLHLFEYVTYRAKNAVSPCRELKLSV